MVAKKSDMTQADGDVLLADITKEFGEFKAVDNVTLQIPQGSFFALLGPSGCGKTTTLRMIAGLEEPTAGSIHIGEEDITLTRPYQRPVNTVFQNYALFPHLDIFENVAFGLRRRGVKDLNQQVTDALDLVELGQVAKRKPGQLSGGQQQRIALARAIVNRPSVLLLDEPLGALDLKLRRQMQLELKRIQTEVGLTFVHVTHDQEEAMIMADTVAVMNEGVIEQMGAPIELYESPQTVFVANFLGQSNLFPATVKDAGSEELLLEDPDGKFTVPKSRVADGVDLTVGRKVLVGIRPEKLNISYVDDANAPASDGNSVDGHVTDASFAGVSTQYLVATPGGEEISVFAQNRGTQGVIPSGTSVRLSWNGDHAFVLEGDQTAQVGAEPELQNVGG